MKTTRPTTKRIGPPDHECSSCHEPEYADQLHDGRCAVCLHAAARKGDAQAALLLKRLLDCAEAVRTAA